MAVNQNQIQEESLERIRQICETFRLDSLKPKIMAIEDALEETDRVNVALLGGFKAGKSSFINSIIGRDALPVGVVPLTSVITYVKYGPHERVDIRFLNGDIRQIGLNELADFIAEDRNPKNVKRVARVDIELPDLRAYQQIQFVDTPGFGSAYQHNTLTATDWLPKVGAAFFVVSSVHPLSERDLSLLKELEKHTSEIIILLSKVDLISQKESGEVGDFVHRTLKQHLHRDFRILSFSNKPGFESMREVVFKFIERSFGANPEQKAYEIISHKIHSATLECQEYLRIALLMANSEQESRKKLAELLQQERESLAPVYREIAIITRDLKTKFQEEALDKFLEHYQILKQELTRDLETQIPAWTGNLADTSANFRYWAEAKLIGRLKEISEETGSKLSDLYLNKGLSGLSRMVHAFQDRLGDAIEQALHTRFIGTEFHAEIEKPRQPDVAIGNVFMTSWEIVWFLIPMPIFRPMVNHHFFKLIPREVERNLYRVRAQWFEAVSLSIDRMAQEACVFIGNELKTIENMLTNATDQRQNIEKAIADLEAIRRNSTNGTT